MKRALISCVLGAALMTSSVAFAGAPLAPGKAAGVQKAESFMSERTGLWILGAGVVIGGIILVSTSHNGGHGAISTTCPPNNPTGCSNGGGGTGGGSGGTGTN